MKQTIITMILMATSLAASAQKVKKVKCNSAIQYECVVNEEKKPSGEGKVTLQKNNVFTFGRVEYQDGSSTLYDATGKIGSYDFKGTMKIDHNLIKQPINGYDYLTENVVKAECVDGTLTYGNKVYELPASPVACYFYKQSVSDAKIDVQTPFLQGKDQTLIPDFAYQNAINEENVKVLAQIQIGNPDYCRVYGMETQSGIRFVLNGNSYEIQARNLIIEQWNLTQSTPGQSIKFDNEEITIARMDSTIGLERTCNYFDALANQPKESTFGIFKKGYTYNAAESSNLAFSKILNQKGSPVVLSREWVGNKGVLTPTGLINLCKIANNLSDTTWAVYNSNLWVADNGPDGKYDSFISKKLIYRGQDVTQLYLEAREKAIAPRRTAAKKEQDKEKAEYEARCKKYGKKFIDGLARSHVPMVGMPEELLLEEFGLYITDQGPAGTRYKSAAFRWYVWVKNGKVTSIHTY